MDILKNEIKPNLAFTLYFSIMFCLYTNTYIQLIAQIGIIMYVMVPFLKNMIIKHEKLNNLKFYFGWFGLFTLLMYLSKYWAYSTYDGSKTMITCFRIFIIGTLIFFHTDCKEKAISVLKSFIVACFIMGVAALITTPLTQYGKEEFGSAIGQHRNQIGAVSAPIIFLCWYLSKYSNLKFEKILVVFFTILTFITGSRSAILQMAIIYMFLMIFRENKLSQKAKNIIIFGIILILFIVIIQNVEFLHNVVWVRMENAFLTIFGKDVADISALGRNEYKDIAYKMFVQKPIFGYGIDGFTCFLRDNPFIIGRYLNAVYSHCNYAEIAADFGIIGLAIWYIPIITIIFKMYRVRRKSEWTTIMFYIFLSMNIFDYSRIPWATHLLMYLFFIIILLCRYEIIENANSKKEEICKIETNNGEVKE